MRIHVHVYGMDETAVALSALITYETAIAKFKEHGHMMTYGGDGKILSEYTTENESNNIITSADGRKILG